MSKAFKWKAKVANKIPSIRGNDEAQKYLCDNLPTFLAKLYKKRAKSSVSKI